MTSRINAPKTTRQNDRRGRVAQPPEMGAAAAVAQHRRRLAAGSRQTRDAMNDGDRKHLTGREVDQLLAAAKGSRNEARDRCLLLLMFRHGLRVTEACRLKLG